MDNFSTNMLVTSANDAKAELFIIDNALAS